MCEVTICAKCKHADFISEHLWGRYCKASPRPETINFVTGEKGFIGQNDLGNSYVTNEKYYHCHTINTDGACKKYEAAITTL